MEIQTPTPPTKRMATRRNNQLKEVKMKLRNVCLQV